MTDSASDPKREMLRHTLATLAYRGGKAVRGAPAEFAGFAAGDRTRTPGKILSHLADLFDWALSMAEGKQKWHDSPPLPWDQGVERFLAALKAFDDYLASEKPLHVSIERLFQGPVADALTHVGQIAMLRGMAGVPVKGENFFLAEVTIGHLALDQALPVFEFD
ncbi:MAG TPA: hypothetical protein VGF06_02275 [Terriglobales bacterium]